MSTDTKAVDSYLLMLIQKFVPNFSHDLVSRCVRILSSSMSPSVTEGDEFHMISVIKRALQSKGKASLAVSFEEKANKLQRIGLSNLWSPLYLLHRLREGKPKMTFHIPNSKLIKNSNLKENIPNQQPKQGQDTQNAQISRNKASKKVAPYQISKNTSFEMSEQIILRDIIFALQGIDGEFIKYNIDSQGYVVDQKIGVPSSTRILIRTICESGWLFRRLTDFFKRCESKDMSGLVRQRLCSALQQEASEYYRLIAMLRNQVHYKIGNEMPNESTLTLRRLYVWMQEPSQRLRLMVTLAESTEPFQGGGLASAIQTQIQHGDPFVNSFVKKQLSAVSVPIFEMIKNWITEGTLNDPYNEFFVESNPKLSDDHLWREKYTICEQMIPSFIDREVAQKILLIGKSINFIRRCCGDVAWEIEDQVSNDLNSSVASNAFKYGNWTDLQKFVEKQYTIVNDHLASTMIKKFHLLDHIGGLMRYMMLGQGDFIQCLMDLLSPILHKSSSRIYRHTLVSVLEMAIRSSNAQYEEKYILKRLDIKLCEPSSRDTGWDVFCLDYHIPSPVNVVITENSMKCYMRVFNFLFKIKRIQYTLDKTWQNHSSDYHTVKNVPKVPAMLHKCHLLQNEMVHFVNNIHLYIMLEVLQSSWKSISKKMQKATDLDSMISAHDKYLRNIVKNCLLEKESMKIRVILERIFDIIYSFCGIEKRLYKIAMEEVVRIQAQKRRIEESERKGTWCEDLEDEEVSSIRLVAQFTPPLKELAEVSDQYKRLVGEFLSTIKNEYQRFESLQLLALRLDFNKFYTKSLMQESEK